MTQSALESAAEEGESPVGEVERMWQDLEYCLLDIRQEDGGQ